MSFNKFKKTLFITCLSVLAMVATPSLRATVPSVNNVHFILSIENTGLNLTATSTDINTYNAAAQTAGDIFVSGLTWRILGSTTTVNAITNLAGIATAGGLIVNARGEEVAIGFGNGADELFGLNDWDNPGGYENIHGTEPHDLNAVAHWTGTLQNGTAKAGDELGDVNGTTSYGFPGSTNALRVNAGVGGQSSTTNFTYLIVSSLYTAVPEPSTYLMLSSTLLLVALARKKKRVKNSPQAL